MSKWDKLIRNILNMSKDIRFNELKKVLESYGVVPASALCMACYLIITLYMGEKQITTNCNP